MLSLGKNELSASIEWSRFNATISKIAVHDIPWHHILCEELKVNDIIFVAEGSLSPS